MSASDSTRGVRRLVLATVAGAMGAMGLLPSMPAPGVRAQIPAVKFDVQAATGGAVSPVYEGWYAMDGRKYALFGYSNRSLEEVVDIAIGPDNSMTPGPPEMAHLNQQLIYITEEDYRRIVEERRKRASTGN